MSIVIEIVCDFGWILALYLVNYHVANLLTKKSTQDLVKDIFNVNIRFYELCHETDTRKLHDVLSTFSITFTFMICSIIPLIHCIMYLIMLRIFDVLGIIRILTTIVLLRTAKPFDPIRRCIVNTNTPTQNIVNVAQLGYLALNYQNAGAAIPVLFELVALVTDIEAHVIKLYGLATIVVDTRVNLIDDTLVFIKVHKGTIYKVQLVCMCVLILANIGFCEAHTTNDFVFLYYAMCTVVNMLW